MKIFCRYVLRTEDDVLINSEKLMNKIIPQLLEDNFVVRERSRVSFLFPSSIAFSTSRNQVCTIMHTKYRNNFFTFITCQHPPTKKQTYFIKFTFERTKKWWTM